jgi:hypothetical protein
MVNSLRQFVKHIISKREYYVPNIKAVSDKWCALAAGDFEPAVQHEAVAVEVALKQKTLSGRENDTHTESLLNDVLRLLDHYKGAGSCGATRSFSYLADPKLIGIIQRDYAELTQKLFPSGAWKSTVIMAGSILEAILFDILTNPTRIVRTMASPAKPAGNITNGDWKLEKLIDVAVETGIMPQTRADTIDQVLRRYRNFVHPKREIKEEHQCNEPEAGLAKYGLDGVCDHLERTL